MLYLIQTTQVNSLGSPQQNNSLQISPVSSILYSVSYIPILKSVQEKYHLERKTFMMEFTKSVFF